MKNNLFGLMAAIGIGTVAGGVFSIMAGSWDKENPLSSLAREAVSENTSIASPAIAALRAAGPDGLRALFDWQAETLQEHDTEVGRPVSSEKQVAWKRLEAALDAVSGQHDCHASHLYWYTDLDQARAAAKRGGRPILSLRLLGRLDEEYTCANSRFFRTTLYANAEVARYLGEHFILHWKSVRPVPRITVDFGDGRKIERTITGNSIHYILDAEGRPIDALPGLYGPKAFLKGLAAAEAAALKYTGLAGDKKDQYLRQYHSERLAAIRNSWRKDIAAIDRPGTIREGGLKAISSTASPTAFAAAPLATSKTLVELPLLKSFQSADDTTWSLVAALHADEAALDSATTALIRSKNPTAVGAGLITITKSRAETPLTSMFQNLERSIAEDTVRNEYLLHSQIHEWFINGIASPDVDQLNGMVYAKLFLTPDSDPWLGLVPANTFTGLENDGLVEASRKP